MLTEKGIDSSVFPIATAPISRMASCFATGVRS